MEKERGSGHGGAESGSGHGGAESGSGHEVRTPERPGREVRTPERPSTMEKRRVGAKFWVRAATALAREPRLWPTALGQAGRLSRPGWWRHPPFLPVPDAAYVRFRLDTQYGSGAARDPGDLVVYLRWCRSSGRTSLRPE